MKEQSIRFRDRTVGVAFVVLTGATIYFAMAYQQTSQELKSVREQNAFLGTQVNKLEASFASIKTYTSTADGLSKPGIKTPVVAPMQMNVDPKKPEGQTYLLRGMSLSAKAGIEEVTQPDQGDLTRFASLITKMDDLNRDAESIVGRLRSLAVILRHNKNLMRAIPSVQPVEGRITSDFGWRLSPFEGKRHMHAGIDIAAQVGATVKAPADGVVTFVGGFDSLGQSIVIAHGNGVITRYGHLSKYLVRKGMKVRRGQAIAETGNTGRSTGPHLHYEVWVRNRAVNPADFFYDLEEGNETLASAKGLENGLALTGGMGGD